MISAAATMYSANQNRKAAAKNNQLPPPSDPTPMPLPDDAAAAEARRRSIAGQIARRGRASTILTMDDGLSDKLG